MLRRFNNKHTSLDMFYTLCVIYVLMRFKQISAEHSVIIDKNHSLEFFVGVKVLYIRGFVNKIFI